MRRSYAGGAQPARLTAALGGTIADLIIYCDDLTNWPDGSGGAPFYVVIDRGNGAEEKILCSSRSGNALTVWSSGGNTGRAEDGTPIGSHSSNAVIEHCFTATDADEANYHVNTSAGVHGLSGTVVGTTDSQTLTNKTLTSPTISGGSANFTTLQVNSVDPVTVSGTQTLTNKTLTTPTITSPVITGGSATNFPPIGTIVAWAGSSAPADGKWLLCNGQAVSTGTYSTLYGVCGDTYNESGGQSSPTPGTFRVPNLSGRVPVGVGDNDFGERGIASGSKTSTAPHTHSIGHGHSATGSSAAANISHTHNANHGHTASGSSNTTGSGHGHGIQLSDQGTATGSLMRQGYNATFRNDLIDAGDGGHTHGIGVTVDANNFDTGGMSANATDHSHPVTVSVVSTTDNSGASSAAVATIGNVQPYVVVNYIIKAL